MIVCALPILFFLIGWWGAIPFVPEQKIFWYAMLGLFAGIVVALVLYKTILEKLFSIPFPVLIILYMFYFIGITGFFMGFLPPAILLSIPTGSYLGARLQNAPDKQKKLVWNRSLLFTLSCLLVSCVLISILTLREKTIGQQIQHMFSLPFTVTQPLVWWFIIAGSVLLFSLHFLLMRYFFIKLAEASLKIST